MASPVPQSSGGPEAERTPLLSGAPATNSSHGTITENAATSRAEAGLEAGQQPTNGSITDGVGPRRENGDGPKIQVNMAALLPALAIGIFLVAMDQTLTIATYGRMGSDLHALKSTSWIATSYFLTLTTFQPLYGRLSDIFGRKECLLFAYTVFGLGCLGCGLAKDIKQLCIARGVAGIGGGGMNAIVSILMTDLVSLRDRGVWQGYINVVFAAGVASGAPIGGLLADSIGWRWAFAGQLPISMLAWVAVYFTLKLPKADHSAWTKKFMRIDFLGAFTLVSAVFLLLFGLDNGSNYGWNKLITIVPLALTPAIVALFILIEVKVASHPFAPGRVILDPPLLAAYGANFFGVASQMGVLFFIALFMQAALGFSATKSGLMFIPSTFAGLCGSLGGGMIMKRTGKYFYLTLLGYTALTLSVIPMVLCSGAVTKSAVGVVLGLSLLAVGSGASITTTLIAIIANSSQEDMAVAVACSYLFRSLGTSIGISASTAVLQQVLRTELADKLSDGGQAKQIEEGVRESLEYIRTLEPAVADIVRNCYAVATQYAFVPTFIFAFLAIVATCFIREKKLDR